MKALDKKIGDHLKEGFEEELGEVAFRLAKAKAKLNLQKTKDTMKWLVV